ncbi:NAD-binding protein [Schizopora paradoxa]|uniref:NAD-binding protein n=1 Tax=Schizopora paradoxa TaxID=27342 RepID=A0A0H2RKT3_9AGAM|nr:NAD-binding protein [Schizopora paradoxa]
MTSIKFAPQTAIVTGAARGIGRSIALRLADDGLDVTVNDIENKLEALNAVADEIRSKGRKALVVIADCTQESEVQHIVDETVKELGRLDVMVANAGIGGAGSILKLPLADWEKVWAVNVRGVFLCYQIAARQMVKQGNGGRIIGASSVLGKKGNALLGAYSSSKFAVRGLTQCAALELGEHGITVNAYAPGIIQTDLIGPVLSGPGSLRDLMKIPDATLGQPENIASIVSYLVKPEAHFITGQSIIVDGGVQFD